MIYQDSPDTLTLNNFLCSFLIKLEYLISIHQMTNFNLCVKTMFRKKKLQLIAVSRINIFFLKSLTFFICEKYMYV